MDTITLPIGRLFDYLSEKHNVIFVNDEIVQLPFEVQVRDENDNFISCSGLITKAADTHRIVFDNDIILEAADKHMVSIEPQNELSRFAEDFEEGDDIPYLNAKCVSNEHIGTHSVYGLQVESDTHLYKTPDGLIHHNTYEVRKAAEMYVDKKRLVYESGDMGAAPSALLAFFFHNKDNKIIILDDNDSMLKTTDQKVANILKALLDPSALTKPISVPTTQMKMINNQLDSFTEHTIEIDVPRLRENILRVSVDGKDACYEHIHAKEAADLLDSISRGERLQEATHLYVDGDDEEDEESNATEREEMEAMVDTNTDSENGITRQFTFNSSVIFVSNLQKQDINAAVLDRVRVVEVNLTLDEFMDRLTKIMHGLCKRAEFNNSPDEYIEWAKKCCWTGLKGVIACWNDGAPLFGGPVIINRKLTFRAFDEFVDTFMEEAYNREEASKGGSLSSKEFRDSISKEALVATIRKSMLPWMKETSRG
jgi:hypothetical protein